MSTHLAGALVTHECALETHELSYVPRAAKPLFIPVAHDPLSTVGHVMAPEPSLAGRWVQSHGTRGSTGALPSHVVGPELRDTWKRRSPSIREVGSRATGHVATSEPSRAGRQDPEPLDKWRHQSPP
jgi:hypothetical protein